MRSSQSREDVKKSRLPPCSPHGHNLPSHSNAALFGTATTAQPPMDISQVRFAFATLCFGHMHIIEFAQSVSSSQSAPELINAELVQDLSHRSVTNKTHLRKLQYSVAKSLVDVQSNSTHSDTQDATTRSAHDENYFMPKRKILRPDGATLLDMYESKKKDMWGQIIKAQYREDVSTPLQSHQI